MNAGECRVIAPEPFTPKEYWAQLTKYRELIWVFAYQEIKTLYAQTYFGIMWALFRPLLMLGIYTAIFKFLLKVPTQSSYHLFAFSGIIAWNYFSQIATSASTAVVSRRDLIRKMPFPKMILPLSKVIVASLDMGIGLVVMFFLLLADQSTHGGLHYLALPFFVLLTIACGLCIAIWMNALNIQFRDLNQIVPIAINVALWFTPVFYPTAIIPAGYVSLMYINPMAGIIKGYRFALLGEPFPELNYWWAIGIMVIVLLAGLWYFRIAEDKMVDYA